MEYRNEIILGGDGRYYVARPIGWEGNNRLPRRGYDTGEECLATMAEVRTEWAQILVCPNCDQWIDPVSNDRFHECCRRGFANEESTR